MVKELLTGNYAIAEAVRLSRVQLVAAYPVTPQTPIYERLSEWESQGKLGGLMMRMESEHSSMAACISASLTGVRVFAATSSQGLAFMHEMLHFASGNRVPVVMACVNRALAVPWAFGSDQTDTLSQRDTGWMQFYCEGNQEALDTVIQAYKVSEQVLLPSMVIIDGFFTSHFIEPVEIPEQSSVDQFLPKCQIPQRFDAKDPGFAASVVDASQYFQFRQRSFEDMEKAKTVIKDVDEEYGKAFGRGYGLIEAVDVQDAEVVLVTSGAITSTARVALESLRKKGYSVGLLKIKTFRPFPTEEVQEVLQGVSKVAVVDRNISIGKEGIFCHELRAALYPLDSRPIIFGYIAGLGGTDVSPEILEGIVMDTLHRDKPEDSPVWIRGD
ncbi:MAG: transketolase C-terminal domain-containing protein [Anaerolineae bacterium]